jgi:hypothetical protein
MLTRDLRTSTLVAHGVLALTLGLIFLYLAAVMTNLLFQAIAVVLAILLSASTLILAAFVDWFIAFNEGIKNFRRLISYTLAGIVLGLAGIFLCSYQNVSMRWPVIFALVHAFVFGILGIIFGRHVNPHNMQRWSLYILGGISFLFSGAFAALVKDIDDRSATRVLGAYLCFVGAKMLFLSWRWRRAIQVIDATKVQNLQAIENLLPTNSAKP